MATESAHPDPVRRLLDVMAALREENGCPWDRQQTHRTLIPFLVEEAYELIEVIEQGGSEDALREELGDVLLQVAFHSRIAEERGAFSFQDVARTVAEKLVTRHPHVFGGAPLESAEEVREQWHEAKMKTRNSALEGVPSGQPALHWARQISTRAARTGFEWESAAEIMAKLEEELAEVREAAHQPEGDVRQAALEEELGDLLFVVMNLARWYRVDPEAALRRTTQKFIARFQGMEKALHERGQKAGAQNPGQWRALWQEAKQADET